MENAFEKRLREEALKTSKMLKRLYPTSSELDNLLEQAKLIQNIDPRQKMMIQEAQVATQLLSHPPFDLIQHTEFLNQTFSAPTRDFITHLERIQGFDIPHIPFSEITALQNIIQSISDLPEFIEDIDEEERDVELTANESLIIKLDDKRRIKVCRRINDGGWAYAAHSSLLPSDIYASYFSEWNTILKHLEDLINDPNVKEKDIQVFFEEHPELLQENTYNLIIPQACIIPDERRNEKPWNADFVLAPMDQNNFCKVLELKRPQVKHLRTKRSGHQKFYLPFWEALQQLKDYGEAFNQEGTRQRFQEEYEVDVFKPDLHLIIGRKWSTANTKDMLIAQKNHHIKIDDWDTYLEQLKRKFA